MKKKLIAGLLVILSLSMVGCNKKEPANENNNTQPNRQEETNKVRSSDEMYELYASKLKKVEELFENNNITFKEEKSEDNEKYNGITSIAYKNSKNRNINEFSIGRYGIAFKDNSVIEYISGKMTMNVNDDEMKTKEFKFEDTEFYKLHNILIPNIDNTAEFNKKVNEKYKDLISTEIVEIENENITERLVIGDNRIDYVIIINK